MAFQVYILEQAESVPTWVSQPHCMPSPPNHRRKLLPGAPSSASPFRREAGAKGPELPGELSWVYSSVK